MAGEGLARDAAGRAAAEKSLQHLRRIFADLPHPMPLVLLTRPGQNDAFADAGRQVIRLVRDLSDRVTLRELDVHHEQARAHGVDRAPTLLFDPDRYRIRWLGMPLGEEGRTFVEALRLVGSRDSGLGAEARRMLGRLDGPRAIRVFVSVSCSYCPQQAVNALRGAIERPDLISVELIDVQLHPDLADEHGAHGVPMTFANGKLIGQGAQTEELFFASLEKLEPQNVYIPEIEAKEIRTDLVIVGGGPAGLTAGIYAARSGLNAAVVEKGVLGGQVATTPVVENYPGLTHVGGKALVELIVAHALQYVSIFPGEEVLEIRPGDPIVVRTSRRSFTTRAVLLATGAKHRMLGVPGEASLAGRGVSFCSTCDGPLFAGKEVLQIGGGNSAVTEALHLHHLGVKVTLVHRRDELRAEGALVGALEADGIPVLYDTEVVEIVGEKKVVEVVLRNRRTGEETRRKADGVFIAIGYDPAADLAAKLDLRLTPGGYIRHDERHRTNVPGIYTAGDVGGGYKQIVIAAGQGAAAAMAIYEDLQHPYWTKVAG